MKKVSLFQEENDDIKISIQIYFNEENKLILDGYDCGKLVKKLRGDYDYEYLCTVEEKDVPKLYELFQVPLNKKEPLLLEIQKQFNDNYAFSKFVDFLKENEVAFSRFSWP